MPRRGVPAVAIAALFLVFVALLGYLAFGQSIVQSSDPIGVAVADSISPSVLLIALGFVLLFLVAIVLLALRSGRSVRIGRDGVHIGRRSR